MDGEQHHIDRVVQRVCVELGHAVPESAVAAQVQACFDAWADVPIRDFVPILAERETLSRLRAAHGVTVSRAHLRSLVS